MRSRSEVDQRVVDLDSRKIYSGVEVCAYALGISVAEVRNHCENLKIIRRFNLMWYLEYMDSNPQNPIEQKIPELIEVIKTPTVRDSMRDRNESIKQFLLKFKTVYMLLDKIVNEDKGLSEWIPIDEFCNLLLKASVEYFKADIEYEKKSYTAKGISKHLNAKWIYYQKYCGLEMKKEYIKDRRHQILFICRTSTKEFKSFSEAEKESIFQSFPDAESEMHGGPISDSKPVVWLEAGNLYSSMNVAHELTGIDLDLIRWCCDGDIDVIKDLVPKTFRYAKVIGFTNKKKRNDYDSLPGRS